MEVDLVMREIVLDTETTGLDAREGDRIIELAAVELDGLRLGKRWHSMFYPDRHICEAATAVHNIVDADLKEEPRFEAMVDDFLAFVGQAPLIAHNAPFDAGFLRAEMFRAKRISAWNPVWIDTLPLAKKKLPRKRHTLDALCMHYGIRKAKRAVHGALLDVILLAEVYCHLIGRLDQLSLDGMQGGERVYLKGGEMIILADCPIPHPGPRPQPLPSRLTLEELRAHKAFMEQLKEDQAHANAKEGGA
jgi:DNA polymerase-3 subunit epsilon